MSVQFHVVTEDHAGQRIDNFLLARLKGVPRSAVYRVLRKGEVRVNKKRVDPTCRLCVGDEVRIPPMMLSEDRPIKLNERVSERFKASYLYEDEGLLILNKPAGMAVHGGSGVSGGVIEYLRALHPEYRFLELAHRLDKETSGCLMIAKSRTVLLELHALLRDRELRKIYQLLVVGNWPRQVHKVDAPLEKNVLSSGERRVRIDSEGQSAVTTFNIIEKFPQATLLEAFPKTGRTHQIRVHAASVGHSIVGDSKYTSESINQNFASELKTRRLFLHAASVKFVLPSSGRRIEVHAPFDDNWLSALEILRAKAQG